MTWGAVLGRGGGPHDGAGRHFLSQCHQSEPLVDIGNPGRRILNTRHARVRTKRDSRVPVLPAALERASVEIVEERSNRRAEAVRREALEERLLQVRLHPLATSFLHL